MADLKDSISADIIIIGGGLGGLFTGALLAHNGKKVIVLEKNRTIGGGLQSFERNGLVFETGMHILGGLQDGGSVNRLCRYLGILDRLDIRTMPKECMMQIDCLDSKRTFILPQGKEAITAYLCQLFPDEAAGIERYFDAIFDMASKVSLFNLRKTETPEMHDEFYIPVGQFIGQFTSNQQLVNILGFASTLYGGQKDKTPSYIHALISVLYINGSSMFAGGSQQLANALADVIDSNGGSVLTGEKVVGIETENRIVQKVTTATRHAYQGNYYISSLHPSVTIQMASPGSFPRAYSNRIASIPNSYSAFKVFYEVKADCFPMLKSPVYILNSQDKFWNLALYDDSWPHGVALFMNSDRISPQGTQVLMAICPIEFSAVEQWSESTTGHRPNDYRLWKEKQIKKTTSLIAKQYPGFSLAIVSSFAATPLTFRDWFGSPGGNMYGTCKDSSNLMLSHIPIGTKVSNLLLTGQCINLHGICGVPLTAVQTAEALLGKGTIIDALQGK